jgi:hypothetical protein
MRGASFGRLWVRSRSYTRKCDQCGHLASFDVPEIRKKIIYLLRSACTEKLGRPVVAELTAETFSAAFVARRKYRDSSSTRPSRSGPSHRAEMLLRFHEELASVGATSRLEPPHPRYYHPRHERIPRWDNHWATTGAKVQPSKSSSREDVLTLAHFVTRLVEFMPPAVLLDSAALRLRVDSDYAPS